MFIVSLTYTADLTEVDLHLAAHIEYLRHCYAQKIFLLSGRKIPRTGGIILVDLDERSKLDKVLAQDPFFIAGVAEYQVTEFVPTMAANALEEYLAT